MSAILLLLPQGEAQQKIAARIEIGRSILNTPIQSQDDLTRLQADRARWHSYNIDMLGGMFDSDAPVKEYNPKIPSLSDPENLYEEIQFFHRSVEWSLNRLRTILEKLELYKEADNLTSDPNPASGALTGRDVFIVHGHAGREYEVAHVIGEFGAKPVILKDELNLGSPTLIEKLEREAKRVGYAIVIFTPDDEGKSVKDKELRPRARQNVVLELGFFIALLGRDKVTILHDPKVEVPSDFGGVTYHPLDEGGAWKSRIEAELRAAGLA
jgi:predicted nucleotide-binding protein